jgi:uncharacterized protein YfaT (DUF1175 family)
MFKRLLIGTIFLGLGSCQTKSVKAERVEDQSFYKMNFIRVALEQSSTPSPNWEPQQRDCAGFVRFVYRSAVKAGGPLWTSWQGDERVSYANAELLVSRNFSKISSVPEDSMKTGDILVFHRAGQKKEDQWHLMMVMESPWEQNKWLVTYHNGARDETGGVKKLWMSDLLEASQSEWKPTKDNKNFVGVYRWNAWVK